MTKDQPAPSYVLPFDSPEASLATVGGKAANLARLVRAGFPVPAGFIITTQAYGSFVSANHLSSRVKRILSGVRLDDPQALESVSEEIQEHFTGGNLPQDVEVALQEAWRPFRQQALAVRSSATAEDLPDLSFAGQQETYLNVLGEQAYLNAVVRCWGSLWTARAIGYRVRNEISQDGLALAVVVQQMVPSQAAGVLFTANPLSGLRAESVIDATFGLGEALVSGQVEPDHYVVDTRAWRIEHKELGAKAVAIHGLEGGGTELVSNPEGYHSRQALADDQVLALARMGGRVETIFGSPQDIEWAWDGQTLHLLQSRPITSLYPIPQGIGSYPLRILFSFGAIQGMLSPMTPLGRDAIRLIFAGGGSLLGFQVTHRTQAVIHSAGERLWGDMTALVQHPVGRLVMRRFMNFVEPSVVQNLEAALDDPQFALASARINPRTPLRLLRLLLPIAAGMLRYWIDPGRWRTHEITRLDEQIRQRTRAPALPQDVYARLGARVAVFQQVYFAFPMAVPKLVPGLVASILAYNALNHLAGGNERAESEPAEPAPSLFLQITRGLPYNVTTEMDLKLWDVACAIREDPESLRRFLDGDPVRLAEEYRQGQLPQPAKRAIGSFLDQYGMRGVGEIDIGSPRWREQPDQVIQLLQTYLQMDDPEHSPRAVFERGAREAEAVIARLAVKAQGRPGGRLRSWLVLALARRFRALAGMRESPKFYIMQLMGAIRQELLKSGAELVAAGALGRADDVFFLGLDELEAMARQAQGDWKPLVAERRGSYQREFRRKQVPRLLLSDGRAYYEGLGASTADGQAKLTGSPVSPGVVEGPVRVVLDPRTAQLAPGDILVCPGTDPAWTPLFLAAGGLVMEVGGLMTHGSVVAREYGIPAVVGVHQATSRLQTGQRVRVDGTLGEIFLLDTGESTEGG